jgi:ubiquinone/menaquinone biosynthesis C-methylase UbiE
MPLRPGGDVASPLPGLFQGTEMPDAAWWTALWPDPAGVLAIVGVKSGMHVIDLCCGDGWFTLAIARIARWVTAIEIDAALLEAARRRLAEAGAANCDFVLGDAYDLPKLVQPPIDFVLLANAFHGVPDQRRLSRAVHDILKPGGRFAVVNWHPRPREETKVLGEPRGPRTELRISRQQTIEAVVPEGLNYLSAVEVPPYHYGALFERQAT